MVRVKRFRGGTTGDDMHHRCFHFHKVASSHKAANAIDYLRANAESPTRFFTNNQIDIALAILSLDIGHAMKFIRQWTQALRQQAQLCNV